MAVPDAPTPASSPTPTEPDASSPTGTPLGAIESSERRFLWSPPLTPTARVARSRVRLLSLVLVALTGLWSASTVWTDGLDAIVFALMVPLMLIGGVLAVDRLMNVGAKLRIEATAEGVTVKRGRVRQLVPYGEITGLAVRSRTPDATSGNWFVVIDRVGRESIKAAVPLGAGSAFDRTEAELLQAELRRRWGG